MLKKRSAKYTLILAFLIQYSCTEDYFSLTNPPEFPWLTVAEFERAAVAPYNYAFFSGWGGHFYTADVVYLDVMSDMLYRIPGASANFPIDPIYMRQTDIDLERNRISFNAGYGAIGLINSALDFYYAWDGNPYPDEGPDEKRNNVDRIAGELHFMRAFCYLYHALRHAPPPGTPEFSSEKILPLRINFTDAEAALNARFVTTDTIYNQVVSDLLEAKKLLPKNYEEGIHHPSYAYGRADKYVAHALLSRVYFYLGEWDLAVAEIDTVISSARYSLDQDPIQAFNRSDASRGHEVIWYTVRYDQTHGHKVGPYDATLFTFLDYRAENGGLGEYYRRSTWHTYSFSNLMAQQIGWMDADLKITEEARRDKRFSQLYYVLEGNRGNPDDDPRIYEQQYPQVTERKIWGNKYFRGPVGRFTNVPVLRLAELYLTRSIIRLRKGDLEGAANDLNLVRARSWDADLSGIEYTQSDQFITVPDMTEELIHYERVKELAYEGDRLSYLQALKLPIPAGEREGVSDVTSPYDGMYWTIPQLEIDFKIE